MAIPSFPTRREQACFLRNHGHYAQVFDAATRQFPTPCGSPDEADRRRGGGLMHIRASTIVLPGEVVIVKPALLQHCLFVNE